MIQLFVDKGIAYVWNADDWYTLRSNHRICGALLGSLPSYPRQNDFLGLPMALSSEEAALLVQKGICELLQVENLTERPSEEERLKLKAVEEKVLLEQTEALKQRKIEQLSHKIDIILAGKKQKLLSKGVTDVALDKQALLQEVINKVPDLAPAHVLVHLPTEHLKNTEKRQVNIEDLNPNVLEGDAAIKFSIFKDLWEQGHYITNGSNFGSDYLVYPGDPVRFHAKYMVRCICDQTKTFLPASLVAFGRLSVAVNKLAVLAFTNMYGKIEYQTLQWHDCVHG